MSEFDNKQAKHILRGTPTFLIYIFVSAVHLAQDVLEDLISCYIHFISMIVKWVFGISKKQKKCLKRCLPE